ncbi:MAG: hypothetical protein M0Q93_01250 [Terrimicrobiaceae bacterium]|nr:hypothetical protein [Terrimicrobiaceae bacterium]
MNHGLLAIFLLLAGSANTQVVIGVETSSAGARDRILDVARASIGLQEKTGNNDGPAIDRILASVGLERTGAPYCAAWNRWVYDMAGFRLVGPRSALASKWVSDPTWTRSKGGTLPKPGDAWGIYFPSKKRVAHTGLVEVWGTKTIRTIEANTSPDAAAGSDADRNGDGVWRKYRLINQIYSAKNWLD